MVSAAARLEKKGLQFRRKVSAAQHIVQVHRGRLHASAYHGRGVPSASSPSLRMPSDSPGLKYLNRILVSFIDQTMEPIDVKLLSQSPASPLPPDDDQQPSGVDLERVLRRIGGWGKRIAFVGQVPPSLPPSNYRPPPTPPLLPAPRVTRACMFTHQRV